MYGSPVRNLLHESLPFKPLLSCKLFQFLGIQQPAIGNNDARIRVVSALGGELHYASGRESCLIQYFLLCQFQATFL